MIGVIADDLTGASDAASAMRRRGLEVAVTFGVPTSASLSSLAGIDVVIAALKTRSVDAIVAVAAVESTADVFAALEIDIVYFKYCSTFDSTPRGNIGAVADALMSRTGTDIFLHVPGYPDNGRTVCHGYLFVDDLLLGESSMRHHPLNPMLDSDLVRLLSPQTGTAAMKLRYIDIRSETEAVALIASIETTAHVLCDTLDNADIDALTRVATAGGVAPRVLVGGGAPMAAALCSTLVRSRRTVDEDTTRSEFRAGPRTDGFAVAIAGSASATTARQIDAFDGPTLRLTARELAQSDIAARVHSWALGRWERGPILVTSNGDGTERLDSAEAEAVELGLAAIARRLVEAGADRIIVAGGETSGAVAVGLGISTVVVGDEICTGVPWTYAFDPAVRIAFKSGNFGPDDFFRSAFDSQMVCSA